jgi:hypothetical protein
MTATKQQQQQQQLSGSERPAAVDGAVRDTPEVAAAKAEHLAAVEQAKIRNAAAGTIRGRSLVWILSTGETSNAKLTSAHRVSPGQIALSPLPLLCLPLHIYCDICGEVWQNPLCRLGGGDQSGDYHGDDSESIGTAYPAQFYNPSASFPVEHRYLSAIRNPYYFAEVTLGH